MAEIGMKPSKKFANGTVHEVGTGKLEILDRYMENNVIMLKYKWLTGEFEGQEETNKEVNVNANIWKFDKVRGRVGTTKQEDTSLDSNDILGRIDDLEEAWRDSLDFFKDWRSKQTESAKRIDTVHDIQQQMLKHIEKFVDGRTDNYNELLKMQEQIKELHDTVTSNSNTIKTLVEMQRTSQSQIEALIRQNDLASKLIEKM